MPNPLQHVTDAAERVRDARTEYRRALELAHRAGEPVSAIARAAGISRQAVYALLARRND
jgi:DNA invertase Pin-like site-specific DNA recombinase